MNRDAVAGVTPIVVTSPMVIGTGFWGGAGIETSGEILGRGTKSSTEAMDTVGLRTSRWVGLDSTPCTFWGPVSG